MDSKIKDTPLDYKPNLDWIDEIVRPKRARPNTDTYDAKLLIRFNDFVQKGAPSAFKYYEGKTPVVIKNIGQMKCTHLKNALVYALKNTDSKLAYTQWFDQSRLEDILEEWTPDFDRLKDCNEAMHLIFSLKEKPDELVMHGLLHATFETLRTCMPDYKFALVPHSHQQHAHVHVFINKTNQITRKRLRFATRTDCKEFFHDLREEFSYRINAWLQTPEHLYVNQPSLKVLDNLKERLRAIRDEEKQAEKDLASKEEHLNHYNQELLSIGSSAIHKRIKHLEQRTKFYEDKLLRVRQILAKRTWEKPGWFPPSPAELKRRATLSKGYNEANKEHFEPLDALDVPTLQDLKAHFTQALEQHQHHTTHTQESLQAWLDYTNTLFEKQTRGFTLLQKKQAIYEQYQRLDKRYLDKNTLVFISQLKSEIEMQRITQERNFINPNFLDHIAQALNHQQPTLKNLKHHFYKLKTLAHLVPQLKEVNPNLQERQLFTIQSNQQTLLNIANERLAFLVQRFNALQQEKEDLDRVWNEWAQQLKQATTQQEQENLLLHPNHVQLNRSLERTSKNLFYTAREILSANRFVNTHAQHLPLILQDAQQLLQKLKTESKKLETFKINSTSQQNLQQHPQGQTPTNSTPKQSAKPSQSDQEITTTPTPPENQQAVQMGQMMAQMMQMLQEQQKVMQMLQEQDKTIQKMAQDITWLKQQQAQKPAELGSTQQDPKAQPTPQTPQHHETLTKKKGRGQ
ncbi:hypothetical protein [Helicobacter suis]|uniref:hypothetical protein n=1 Tax=Helicobacter suis TaxID=104628 RepID=UPI0013D0AD68|nr:hypothetical protein [Helicobacter suis]